MKARIFLAAFIVTVFADAAIGASNAVRTGDPAKRGLKPEDLRRTVPVAESVISRGGCHPGSDIFNTTDVFVVAGR